MNSNQINTLSVKLLRTGLSASEQAQHDAWLQESPENLALWTEEHRLNQLLTELPIAPLSSNFTSQLVQQLRREQRPFHESKRVNWIDSARRIWFRPLAATATLGMVAFLVYRQQSHLQQGAVVESVKLVSGITTALQATAAPSIELLTDFEAIRRLGTPNSEPDLTLLAVLQ